MKKITTVSACVLTLLLAGSVNSAELSSTIGFTNDYRYHGISQTAGDAALQGSIDIAFDNGVYAGIWGSNVDFGDDANLEIDYYAGYAGSINEAVAYDATLLYFQYPGYLGADMDYAEIDFGLHFNDVSFLYTFTDNYANTSETSQYISVDYTYAVTETLGIALHAGHSFGNYWDSGLDINAARWAFRPLPRASRLTSNDVWRRSVPSGRP